MMARQTAYAARPFSALMLFASLAMGCGLPTVQASVVPPSGLRMPLQDAIRPSSSSPAQPQPVAAEAKGGNTTVSTDGNGVGDRTRRGNNAGGNGVGDIASAGRASDRKVN